MRQLGAVLLVVLVSGCAISPEEDPVQIKLNDVDGRVQRIERVVSNQSLLEMAQKLDAAQADVRALRGRIEVLENSNEALRKQQRELYSDLDKRPPWGGGSHTRHAGRYRVARRCRGAGPRPLSSGYTQALMR
jgi:TolA-binding protein